MKLFSFIFLLGLCATPFPSPLSGNDAPRVSLSPGPYFVGDSVTLSIVVPGSREPHQVDLSPLTDLETRLLEAAPLQGSTEPAFLIRVRIPATRAGSFEVPSLRVFGPAGTWQTDPLTVEIGEAEPTGAMRLKVDFEKDRVYLGEPFVVEVEWSFDETITAIHAVDLRLPVAESPLFKVQPRRTGPSLPGEEIGLPVSQSRVMARVMDRTIRFRMVVVPLETGTHTLSPATLLVSRSTREGQGDPGRTGAGSSYFDSGSLGAPPAGFRYPSYFDNQFFNAPPDGAFERVFTRSEPATITVLPLPETGRPRDFSGIVGSFSLESSVAPERGSVGTPLRLEVTALDHKYPEALDIPPLEDLPGFSGRFNLPADRGVPALEEKDGGWARVFRQSIRPLATGVEFVPEIRLGFFDPENAEYRTAVAAALPLRIDAGRMATAFDATLSDGSRIRNRLEPTAAGIGANYLESSLHTGSARSAIPTARFWTALFAVPPLLFLAGLPLTRRLRLHRLDPPLERSRYAFHDLRRETRGAGDEPARPAALRRYFARRLDCPDAALTPGSIAVQLRENGLDPARFRQSLEYLQQHDESLFARSSEDKQTGTWAAVREEIRAFEERSGQAGNPLRARLLGAALLIVAAGVFGWARAGSEIVSPAVALPAEAIREAERFFRSGVEQQFDRPEAAEKDFERAAALYELAIKEAGRRFDLARLHYNAGSARFFSGENGLALAHFHRTLALDPAEPLSRRAISHIRVSRIDGDPAGAARRTLLTPLGWQERISYPARRLILASVVFIFWGLLLLHALQTHRLTRPGAIAAGLLILYLGAGFWIDHRQRQLNDWGVVTAGEVVARQGDGLLYEPALRTPLHDGFEFRVLERRGDWLRIDPGGSLDPVWIPARSAISIYKPYREQSFVRMSAAGSISNGALALIRL